MNMKNLIVVRGGGDLATGTIHRLWSAGFPVVVLETEHPAAIRRQVSVCDAVYEGEITIEGMRAVFALGMNQFNQLSDNTDSVRFIVKERIEEILSEGAVPVLADPEASCLDILKPSVVIDATIAKRNLGTHKGMAPLTIALGPGFEAGKDVDYVVETMRGHNLGRIIRSGSALANTGVPGNIGGYTSERVIHAECAGIFRNVKKIGDIVETEEVIAYIESTDDGDLTDRPGSAGNTKTAQGNGIPVKATIPGILRGLLRNGYPIPKGFKIADIDPRISELQNCFTISDKARCIAGSVLELCVASIM